jgi:serine/threonine protein kinase/Cu/Zn superoxide dismutase
MQLGQLENGSVIGGYRIDALISRGGMGVVYRATNTALNRVYALKVIAPELAEDERFRERFRREMRIAASLNHPNIVGIHYAGEQDGLLFFVMDFVSGSDLRELLKTGGSIEPNRAVELLRQCASALDAAHARGLMHRDVKPANILITVHNGEEHAYLTDFGVAKRFDTVSGLTAKGAAVGTVDYMAPEQISGDHTDARADVYALGCVFFQMLVGKVPYERDNSVAKLFAHVNDPPPPLAGPIAQRYPTFSEVIDKAMAKDPADRYLSAGDFARDATAALAGSRFTGPETVVATGEATPTPTPVAAAAEPTPPPPLPPDPTPVPVVAADPIPTPAAAPTPPPAAAADPTPPPPPAAADPTPPSPPAAAPPPGSLKRYRLPAAILIVLAAAAAVVIIVSSGGSSTPPGRPFASVARPVPTNRVTGAGSATVRLNGTTVTVTLDTEGLLNGSPHAMHIHAGGQGICPPASAARPHNGHLSISTTDGIKFYGPPEVSLTSHGDTSAASRVDFTRYPTTGDIRYTRTFTVPVGIADAIRSDNAVIVVHGIDYNHNGVYDNVLDRSELNSALTGESTAPALCGSLLSAQTASTGAHGAVYTASLHVPTAASAAAIERFLLLCHLAAPPPTAADRQAIVGAPPLSAT